MRNVITLNKNRQEAGKSKEAGTEPNLSAKYTGQPVIQIRQNRLTRQHKVYSEQEHTTVSIADWSMQLAEEDMYDPDLLRNVSSNRGYMLQPG
ncbi:MAG: hypothetical protein V4628_01205 [Pseudomonadota bacterium]